MKDLIIKYLKGRATEPEQHQLLSWLGEKENHNTFKKEKAIWRKQHRHSIPDQKTEQGLLKFQAHIMKHDFDNLTKLRKARTIYRYVAAILIVMLLAGGGMVLNTMLEEPMYTCVVADNGQVSKIVLPDNSEVWLNSGSRLTYSDKYAKSNRNLQLEGQAYFNISHNGNIPLVVQSNDVNVKVLGTKFEVEAYGFSNSTTVTLEEGSVEMSLANTSDRKLLLEPGQQVVYNNETGKITRQNVRAEKITAWRRGVLNIYNSPLSEAMEKLERRFNYKFKVHDNVKEQKITLSLEDEDFDDVINILRHIAAVEVEHRNDTIYLQSKQ